jgi:heat shock protein HtpX
MKVRYLSEREAPQLYQLVKELALAAKTPQPKIGLSAISLPNAFAFGRSQRDGRICVTEGLIRLLNREELRAVLAHEVAHLKHRDMLILTLISVVPLVLYWLAWQFLWGGMWSRRSGGYFALIGLGAMILYFLTNLLVLYGSRIREYYADERSVKLGNSPHNLASALYKLVYFSAKARRNPVGQEDLKRVAGLRAFFLNDVERGMEDFRELREIDRDFSGSIDASELPVLREKKIKLSSWDKLMEIFTTHPHPLKRIQRLAKLG